MTDRSSLTLMSLEFTSALDVSGDERLSFTALANDDASIGQASINFAKAITC